MSKSLDCNITEEGRQKNRSCENDVLIRDPEYSGDEYIQA
jgi:hypothetical protein